MKRYSIIHDLSEKSCLICEAKNTHTHEVFFGYGLRELSIKYGLCVCLCARHHNMGSEGVHFNKNLDNLLKAHAQKIAMEHYGWDTAEFIKIFGKNYL